MGVHTGAHVDAPNHFIEGAKKVSDLDLNALIGKCKVVELNDDVMSIGLKQIEKLGDIKRILFKTRNSQFWNDISCGFRKDFTHIEPDAAQALIQKGVILVGIDYLSVEAFGAKTPQTHIILLEREVIILEGLDLREIVAGEYELICLPLKIAEGAGDGAPSRTILIEK